MKQYKTIAGPIGLTAQTGEDYNFAVKQYAKIIDTEAVGGWELHLIQQITVRKRNFLIIIIVAIIGAVAGGFVGRYDNYVAQGIFIGLCLGGGLGCLWWFFSYKDVLFNMLVFVKDDGITGNYTTKIDIPYKQVPTPTTNELLNENEQVIEDEILTFWICENCSTSNSSISAYCRNCPDAKP
ncbi:MAG: hypothetical protein LBC73_03210 [Oscillospiraceae bacterium]|nr:hypothetical protein [Oscillospiraceae bacterium]